MIVKVILILFEGIPNLCNSSWKRDCIFQVKYTWLAMHYKGRVPKTILIRFLAEIKNSYNKIFYKIEPTNISFYILASNNKK